MATNLTGQQQLEEKALRYPYILAGVGLGATFLLIAGAVAITGVKPANFTELVAIVGAFTGFIGTLIGSLVGIKVGAAAGEKVADAVKEESAKKDKTITDTQAALEKAHETILGSQANLSTVHQQLAEQTRLLDQKSNLLQKAIAELPPEQARSVLAP